MYLLNASTILAFALAALILPFTMASPIEDVAVAKRESAYVCTTCLLFGFHLTDRVFPRNSSVALYS